MCQNGIFYRTSDTDALRLCLIGGVEKWEDRKVGEQKRFSFLLYVFGWKDGKVICLVKNWNERMTNEIDIDL